MRPSLRDMHELDFEKSPRVAMIHSQISEIERACIPSTVRDRGRDPKHRASQKRSNWRKRQVDVQEAVNSKELQQLVISSNG